MAAKSGRSRTPPLWESWSPDLATGRTQIHRRYVQVPSAQAKLLERPDAWSAGQVPNVPPDVLADVKARHANQPRPRADPEQENEMNQDLEPEALSSQPASPDNATREPLDSQPVSPCADRGRRESLSSQPSLPSQSSQPVSPARDAIARDEPAQEDDGASEIPISSWSPSPSAHFGEPGRHKKLPATKSAFQSVRSQDFPPSSSGASEMELEFVAPGAVTDVIEVIRPASRGPVAAVLEPTPPLAQIIPCSIVERTSPVRTLDAKRRRLMKPPTALFTSPKPAGRKHASRPTLPQASVAATSVPRSSSPLVGSSSPISARAPAHPAEIPAVPEPVDEDNCPQAGDPPPYNSATSQPPNNQGSSNSTDKLPPNGPPSQVPFTAFRVAYPGYQGSLGDFIRGVLCILQLQKDKALPEFLYDDFIRVFSGDYLNYIKTLDTSQPALPAILWYNHNVSRPLYTKSVLVRDNIHDVALQYPVEVRAIHRKLKPSEPEPLPASPAAREARDKETTSKSLAHRPPARVVESHDDLQQDNPLTARTWSASPHLVAQEALPPVPKVDWATQGQPVAQEPRKTVARPEKSGGGTFGISSAPRSRVEASTWGGPRGAAPAMSGPLRTQVDSSFPVIQSLESPQMGEMHLPIAGTPSLTMLSQISNPDSIPEATLKRRVAPRATAASSAAEPGAKFKRRKTAAKTTDSSRKVSGFRTFLLQKKMQSSAPGGSAPSS